MPGEHALMMPSLFLIVMALAVLAALDAHRRYQD
jgi:hypothetical protein